MTNLLNQTDRAKQAGATVELGGKRINREGFYLEPTILAGITEDNPFYREETFGPVASFYTVDTEDDAVRLANGTPYGLGGSVPTADLECGRHPCRENR